MQLMCLAGDGHTEIAPLYYYHPEQLKALPYVPPTFAAYRAKRDPALEAILAYRGG